MSNKVNLNDGNIITPDNLPNIKEKSDNYGEIFILIGTVVIFIIWTCVTFFYLKETKKYSIIVILPLSVLGGVVGTIFTFFFIAANRYGTF
jgi:hypothetical protein